MFELDATGRERYPCWVAVDPPDGKELECARCGAPLDWDGIARSVTCRYCDLVVAMRAPVAAPAPVAPAAAPATTSPESGSGDTAKAVALLLGVVVALAVIVGAVAFSRGDLTFKAGAGRSQQPEGVSVAEITAVNLATTPEQLAKRLRGTVVDQGVTLKLRESGFDSIGFFWDARHLDHVRMVVLSPPASGIPASVLPRVQAQLGRELRVSSARGHQYQGPGVTLSLAVGFIVNAVDLGDPLWKERLTALFTVMKGAALGTSDTLGERAKQDLLNLGYPLGRVAEVDLGVPMESAERELERGIPGVVSSGARHDVGLRHAWFERASLVWKNDGGGKLQRVVLDFDPAFSLATQREALATCLAPALGTPRVSTAGDLTLHYDKNPQRQPEVRVRSEDLTILPPRSAKEAPASVKRLLGVLAGCG